MNVVFVSDSALVCTERSKGYLLLNSHVLADLRLQTCLKNINAGLPFPGRREDFADDASFQHWKSLEQSHLSQMMVAMIQFNPELAKSTPSEGTLGVGPREGAITPRPISSVGMPRPETFYSDRPGSVYSQRGGSVGSRQSLFLNGDGEPGGEDDGSGMRSFVYIPDNPRKFYKKLIERCIEYDLRAMHTLPEDQEVPLGILSSSHLDLVNECALRWRVQQSYRVACFLDVIKYKYEREEVPMECIPEALTHVEKEWDPEKWPLPDVCPSIIERWLHLSNILFDRESI